jgi:hypothetical protein
MEDYVASNFYTRILETVYEPGRWTIEGLVVYDTKNRDFHLVERSCYIEASPMLGALLPSYQDKEDLYKAITNNANEETYNKAVLIAQKLYPELG